MNAVLIVLALWLGLSFALSPLLGRVARAAAANSLVGGPTPRTAVEGWTRPVVAAVADPSGAALPGVSPTSSLPADSAPGGEGASPATVRDSTVPVTGDASKLPTPHVGTGWS